MGNKADFVEEGEGVKDEEVEEWVKEEGLAGFTRTSAKSGSGVAEVSYVFEREDGRGRTLRFGVREVVFACRAMADVGFRPLLAQKQAFDALTREVHVRQMEARKRNTALNQGSGSSFPLTLGGKGGKGGCC